MAQITFTIPDAFIPRVVDAFCSEFGYDPLKEPPVTKAAFTKAKIRDYIDEIDGVEIT